MKLITLQALFSILFSNMTNWGIVNTSSDLQRFQLSSIISKFFPTCDLYLTNDDSEASAGPASEILSSSIPPANFILHLSTYFQERNWNSTKCSHISCFPLSIRKYSHCTVVIGLFFQGTDKLPQFNELLFAPYAAPVRNERASVIFLTSPKVNLDSFLQHKALKTIKYKLGIELESPSNEKLIGKSNCFFCANGEYKITEIDIGSAKTAHDLFPDFTRNGHGRSLRASGPMKYPFLYELEHVGNDKWESKRGVYHFALLELLPHFNFTFVPYPSRNGGSGTHFENGTWDGVIGDMVYDRADFGTAASANPERYQIVSFTNFPISYIYVTFMMGSPRKTYTWKAVYWPFAWDLWLGVVISITIVVLIFKLMDKLLSDQKGQSIYRHLFENISFALLGQGYDCSDPGPHAARFLLAVWLFATIIINTLYVTQVVGLLAFPLYQVQPFTFKALVESGFEFGFDRSGGSLFAHFKHSKNPIFHEIFERRLPEQDAIDCFNLAVEKNFACITWSGVADYTAYRNMTLKHGKSPLVFADEKTQFIPSGIMLPLRSLFRDNFNTKLGMLTDSGQDEKWLQMDYQNLRKAKVKWQHSMGMKADDEVEDEQDLLSLSNLLGIFYIYIVGHILSILLFGWEQVKVRKDRAKQTVLNVSAEGNESYKKYQKAVKATCNIGTWSCGICLKSSAKITALHNQENAWKVARNLGKIAFLGVNPGKVDSNRFYSGTKPFKGVRTPTVA